MLVASREPRGHHEEDLTDLRSRAMPARSARPMSAMTTRAMFGPPRDRDRVRFCALVTDHSGFPSFPSTRDMRTSPLGDRSDSSSHDGIAGRQRATSWPATRSARLPRTMAAMPDDPETPAEPRHTNRLAGETSPYLLQHAHNPVDWYPWGPEALAAGARDGPPDLPVDRLCRVPLVPRHGARVVRGRGDGRRPERRLRRDQGRSRGAARPRRDLHGCRPGDDRAGRLADERVPHARRPAVLRRHLLPGSAAPRHAVVPRSCSRGSARSGASDRAEVEASATRLADHVREGQASPAALRQALDGSPTTDPSELCSTRPRRRSSPRSMPATAAGAARPSSRSR